MLQRGERVLPPETGLLGAAEGDFHGGEVVGVDPERAGLQTVDDAVRAGEVGCEDPAGQAEFRGVAAFDHLVLIVEVEHAHDRPEYAPLRRKLHRK